MTAQASQRAWAATTLTADDLRLIDDVRNHTGESRSDYLRQAIRLKLLADVTAGFNDQDLELRVYRYLNQHT